MYDVDDARKVVARSHGHRDGSQAVAVALLGGSQRNVPIGVGTIQAVDEERAGYGEILGRVPEPCGDGTWARRRVDDEDGRLGCGKRTIGVTHEVRVAGRVEHVDATPAVLDRCDGRRDREATLPLLDIIVKRGLGAGVATQTGRLARQVQHSLRQHGLAHATLAHERKVLYVLSTCSHIASSSLHSSMVDAAPKRHDLLNIAMKPPAVLHVSGDARAAAVGAHGSICAACRSGCGNVAARQAALHRIHMIVYPYAATESASVYERLRALGGAGTAMEACKARYPWEVPATPPATNSGSSRCSLGCACSWHGTSPARLRTARAKRAARRRLRPRPPEPT